MSSIDISIIIVSNNHQHYLERCLSSLVEANSSFQIEIFVVDNASSDNTVAFVKEKYPQVTVIASKVKRGFSANNNLGIQRSAGRYIMLLNPDTEVSPNALSQLVNFMDSHPQVGICGPQLRFPDNSVQLSCRAFPTWKSVLVRRTPLRVFLRNSAFNKQHLLADQDHSVIREVDWLLGAALMIRHETLEAIGRLDERYFLYVEDIDYCRRAYQQGWQVFYMPEAVIIHHHLAVSDRKFLSKYTYYHFISMFYYAVKYNLPGGQSVFRRQGEFLIDFLNGLVR
ncbi:MAG: glycosyltransferase family 2 protein [Chloroflexota bacterium]